MAQYTEKSGKVVFKEYDQRQIQLLPPSLEELIPEHHLVRVINSVVDGLEFRNLERVYRGGGTSSYHPKMMLKVLIYAYSTKVYSCRQIAASLEKDIHFMWLSAMQRPSFRTINNFRSCVMKDLIEEIFGHVLEFLMDQGYVKLENYFVDGTKLRADANKYSHVWASNTRRYKGLVQERVKRLFQEIDQLNEQEDVEYGEQNLEEYGQQSQLTSADLMEKAEQINAHIEQLQQQEQLTPQQTRKRKSHVRHLKKEAEKLTHYENQEQVLQERKSFSKTDPDATFMRMKDDQLLPAYNILMGTENQFIVNYTLHQTAGETNEFVTHLTQLSRFTGQIPKNAIGDAAYGSQENYDHLQTNGIGNYLKYSGIYMEKTKRHRANRFHMDNLPYDADKDQFICPNNQPIEFQMETTKKSKSGYRSQIRVYECKHCSDCPLAGQCKSGKGNRQIKFSPAFDAYKIQVKANLSSETGRKLRSQRSVDVETPFGDIKHNMGYQRFRLRGLKKVEIEWGLVSIAHNLRKIGKRVA